MEGGVWAARLDRPLTEAEEAYLLAVLPPERHQRLLRLPQREQRRGPLCAYRLLALALAEELGWDALPPMGYGPLGKPRFPDFPEVAFNLSHTEGAVLVGLSRRDIGVDIQRIRPASPGLMKRFGASSEAAFFESWVRREARAKRTGTPVELGAESPLAPEERLWFPETIPGCAACVAFEGRLRREVRRLCLEELL